MAAQGIERRRALPGHEFARSMAHQFRLVLNRAHGNEALGWPPRRLADRRRVGCVVLVAPDIGLHVRRRDEPPGARASGPALPRGGVGDFNRRSLRARAAGQAVTVSFGAKLPAGLRVVREDEGLPQLPDDRAIIIMSRTAIQPLTDALAEVILKTFSID